MRVPCALCTGMTSRPRAKDCHKERLGHPALLLVGDIKYLVYQGLINKKGF